MGNRASSVIMEYPLCHKYGFDTKKRTHYVNLMGLTPDCHEQVKYLHHHVIQPYAELIVNEFYDILLSFSEISEYLKKHTKVEHLKVTQLLYLKTYGVQFDTEDYFEQRLQVGQVHAQIRLPLSYYKTAFRILDEILFNYIAKVTPSKNNQLLPLIKLVTRISTFDMSLAIDTYHHVKVQGMSSSIDALRDERKSLSSIIDCDALTGVASRSRSFEYLKENIENALATNDNFCVAMIDLDFFKSVNDEFGHLVGDQILTGVAARMKSVLREGDMLGRYGGEEFVLIFPHASIKVVEKILVRLCKHVADDVFQVEQHSIPITVSIGVTDNHKKDNEQDLLGRADQALYKAKNNGRDQVVVEYC